MTNYLPRVITVTNILLFALFTYGNEEHIMHFIPVELLFLVYLFVYYTCKRRNHIQLTFSTCFMFLTTSILFIHVREAIITPFMLVAIIILLIERYHYIEKTE